MTPESAVADEGARIEALLGELRMSTGPVVLGRVEELVERLVALYGEGLGRIVALLGDAGTLGEPVLRRLAEDPLVSALLVLHGLHPDDATVRIEAALERARPLLASHAGGATLVGLDGGVVRIRLEGRCDGCPSSAATAHGLLERAIREAAPEIVRLEIESADAPATPRLVPLGRRGPAP